MSYKIIKIYVKFILNEIIKNKTITIQELLSILKDNFKDFDVSLMHLHRIINNNHITLKNAKLRHGTNKKIWKRYKYSTTN
jgi:hypothetical protein